MKINGTIKKVIPSRSLVSFGGFIGLTQIDTEYYKLYNIFKTLSQEFNFYCNHVVLEIECLHGTYYIGLHDNRISIGNSYQIIGKEDSRHYIEINRRIHSFR